MRKSKALGPDMSREKLLNEQGHKYGGEQNMKKAVAHIEKGGESVVCPHGNTSLTKGS